MEAISFPRHNEIRVLEAEILQAMCTDVKMEPVLQEVNGEVLPKGANNAPDVRLEIRARGFWAREQSALFDVGVCHPNADSYKNLTTEQIYKLHENDKKRLYSSRVLEVERGTGDRRVTLPLSHGLGLESHLPF